MGQFSSPRSGPPPEALPHPRLPARSVVLELHGVRNEVHGDLAYTVAFEHTTVSINGATP